MIDYEIEDELRPLIGTAERIQWTGRPKRGLRFQKSDAAFVPFSLLWACFVFLWEGAAFAMGAPLLFKLWGIPFILMGIYLIVGRFFVDAKMREGTRYAITNQRIIIRSGVFDKKVQSLNIKTLPSLTYEEYKDGSGTIHLGPATSTFSAATSQTWPGAAAGLRLEMIEDAREAYDLILRLQGGHTPGHTSPSSSFTTSGTP